MASLEVSALRRLAAVRVAAVEVSFFRHKRGNMSRALSDLSMPLLLTGALPALGRPRLRGGLPSLCAGGQGSCAFAVAFDFADRKACSSLILSTISSTFSAAVLSESSLLQMALSPDPRTSYNWQSSSYSYR